MGVLTIRKLDDAVLERIKSQARVSGRSMEEEARQALGEAYRLKPSLGPWLTQLRVKQVAMFGDRTFPDSIDLIRELREEGPNDLDRGEG